MSSIKDTSQVKSYLEKLASLLGLGRYEFLVLKASGHGRAKCPYLAQIEWVPGRAVAHVTLGKSFFEQSPEEVRTTLVHELLHLYFRDLDVHLDSFGPLFVSKEVYEAFTHEHSHTMECAIEELSKSISTFLPLPEG